MDDVESNVSFDSTGRCNLCREAEGVLKEGEEVRFKVMPPHDPASRLDWQAGQVTNNVQDKPWNMALPANTLDKLSYQLQLRQDLSNQRDIQQQQYTIADGGRLKHYRFETQGEEILSTPVGKLNTIKVKRIREHDSKRITYLWLAKDWDHLIVRLRQKERDGKHYEINLARATLNGRPVQGH